MLADDVIAFPKSPKFRATTLPAQREGYEALGKDIAQAERFVLRRDAVWLLHSLCSIPMSRITPALPICRMPFPKMWVELVYRDRDDWYNLTNVERSHIADASSPSRLGYYIEQQDKEGRIIECTIVWRHYDDPNYQGEAIVIGGFSMHIDTTPGVQISEEKRANMRRAQLYPTEIEKRFHLVENYDDPVEEEAALELETRINLKHCKYMLPFWAYILATIPQSLKLMEEHALFDCLQEWRFILGLLTVINSRNVISYSEPITYEKLNKQRAKKNLSLMHDHREIRLSLSRVQRNRVGDAGGEIDIQAHTVMGHWKLRRTGLFWWSPHVRGSGPVRPKPYVVRV